MTNEAYREWAIEHEYEISRRVFHLASKCPRVTWNEAQKLYQLAVEEAKIILRVEHICDATFGRGIALVSDIFAESITSLERFRVEEEQTKFNHFEPNDNDEEGYDVNGL
jgi:hypothetical protein